MKLEYLYYGTGALVLSALLLAAGYGLGRGSPSTNDIAPPSRRSIYVIHEFCWRWRSNRAPEVLDDGRPGKPVLAFTDRARADERCQQLNVQKRAESNPFRYMPEGGEYTSLREDELLALIKAEGLTPPAKFPRAGDDDLAWAWFDWWNDHFPDWDAGRVQRLRGALNPVDFYEVREVALEP